MSDPVENDLKVERSGHTLVITLNRPASLNAVTTPMSLAIADALEEAQTDDDIRSVVITGAGRAFCAGADIKESLAGRPEIPERYQAWGWGGFVRHFISKPVIAAVNGLALGGGMELVLATDLVVADEKAVFGLPEVKIGTLAAGGGCFRLLQELPPKVALKLLWTGDSIDADEALRLGLINEVVRDGRSTLEAALELAASINKNAPLSVQAIKRIAYGVGDGTDVEDNFWRVTKKEQLGILQTEDAVEGRRAFVEKREPAWQNR
ncbi:MULTISPECIES: enoyl-CoA hydratase/isomerase family protein [unclassified Nocardioides]|uniref:enoyl-CoA hydratase/isomerase family protein n=1 Tax=unclassified Nocardioides TaxID=2615069 RepID=UPI0019107858|nr:MULTISPECIES: enoyl-CoA hydratase-related protein [unclassified Nocardioides]